MVHGKRLPLIPRCIFSVDGQYTGVLKYSYFRPRATFSGREGDFTFFREKFANGSYFLMSNAGLIAQAKKPNDMGIKYDVQFQNDVYKLVPGDEFYEANRLQYVVRRNEQEHGEITASWRKIEIILDSSFPVSAKTGTGPRLEL